AGRLVRVEPRSPVMTRQVRHGTLAMVVFGAVVVAIDPHPLARAGDVPPAVDAAARITGATATTMPPLPARTATTSGPARPPTAEVPNPAPPPGEEAAPPPAAVSVPAAPERPTPAVAPVPDPAFVPTFVARPVGATLPVYPSEDAPLPLLVLGAAT